MRSLRIDCKYAFRACARARIATGAPMICKDSRTQTGLGGHETERPIGRSPKAPNGRGGAPRALAAHSYDLCMRILENYALAIHDGAPLTRLTRCNVAPDAVKGPGVP